MDFSAVCRTCLCDDHSLNPLFKDNDDHDTFAKALYMATGTQIRYNDNLPQNMCTNCIIKLNNTLKFRRQCRDAETQLIKKIKGETNVFKTRGKRSIQNSGGESEKSEENKFETTIKIEVENDENEYLSNYDVDDDMHLKLLATSEKPDFKPSPKYEPDKEDQTSIYDTARAITDNEIKVEKIKEEKPELADNGNCDPILTDNELNDDSNTSQISFNNMNNRKNSISSTKTNDVMDLPYVVLMDSVTQKATRVLCKLCNKELSIRSIDFHMARCHPGADERKIKCDLCDIFVLKNKLNRHMILRHGSGCFKCGYCKLDFANKEQLVEHVDTCTAKKRKRKTNEASRELRECDECHKVMQKASLRMHKAVKHAGLKPVCEHCGKNFGNKFRLNEHYRAKHGYEKFQCHYCEFQSASTMAMKNHERRHRDEKPFVCEECGAKFHAAYLLAQHRQSHRTEKLIKCDLCSSTFKANNGLHMHKLTCHSNLTYKCDICNRSYKCRHYVVKHIRHVHRYTGTSPPLTVVNNDDVVEKAV
ncbi:unnamed protein product [Arctia plantaginis]|uniref:Uncharacterized protein n=1 Tax=Arctia plantaginis TaxID=874455 RepID=A0A8S1AV70_ARCPL|nr:unnamed protein product [Arctia plantaginis]